MPRNGISPEITGAKFRGGRSADAAGRSGQGSGAITSRSSGCPRCGPSRSVRARPGIRRLPRVTCGSRPSFRAPAQAIIEANRVFSEARASLDMPLFTTFTLPACFWERAFIFILATPVTEDPATNKRYREGFKKLIEIGGQHGWGEYRTAPVFQKSVHGCVFIQQPRPAAFSRNAQGCDRPERHPLGRTLRDLAEASAARHDEELATHGCLAATLLGAGGVLWGRRAPALTLGVALAPTGRAVYEKWCAPCHDPGIIHPGTHALMAKYPGGKRPRCCYRVDGSAGHLRQVSWCAMACRSCRSSARPRSADAELDGPRRLSVAQHQVTRRPRAGPLHALQLRVACNVGQYVDQHAGCDHQQSHACHMHLESL